MLNTGDDIDKILVRSVRSVFYYCCFLLAMYSLPHLFIIITVPGSERREQSSPAGFKKRYILPGFNSKGVSAAG